MKVRAVAVVMVSLLALVTALGQAPPNTYSVSYSGGNCTVTSGSPGGPYALNSGSWAEEEPDFPPPAAARSQLRLRGPALALRPQKS
jgi:hypothetical protein